MKNSRKERTNTIIPQALRGRISMKAGISILIGWLTSAVFFASAQAQSFRLDWFTVNGGGGTSTSGVYSVNGTVGQPHAGTLTGGGYTLAGGYWSIVTALQTPGAPTLSVTNSNGAVTVSWDRTAAGFLLEETSLLAPEPPAWSPVNLPYRTNATHFYIQLAAPAGHKFYRLHKP